MMDETLEYLENEKVTTGILFSCIFVNLSW